MGTSLRQPIGQSNEFEILMKDPRRPDKPERTFVAIFTWEAIERIEALASRHYGRMTTIFELIERPGITNLAILLCEAINHDNTDTSWGGSHLKPDLKKFVRILGHDAAGRKFLEIWRACALCVRENIRPDEDVVPPPSGQQATTTTTTSPSPTTPPSKEPGSGPPSVEP